MGAFTRRTHLYRRIWMHATVTLVRCQVMLNLEFPQEFKCIITMSQALLHTPLDVLEHLASNQSQSIGRHACHFTKPATTESCGLTTLMATTIAMTWIAHAISRPRRNSVGTPRIPLAWKLPSPCERTKLSDTFSD